MYAGRLEPDREPTKRLLLAGRAADGRFYTGSVNPWIKYSLVRLGIFLAAFAVLYLALPAPLESIGIVGFATIVIAAVTAAVIALTVSYIFFAKLRDAVALDLAERRRKPVADPDAAAEDAAAEDAPAGDAAR